MNNVITSDILINETKFAELIKSETTPRTVRHWGDTYNLEPVICTDKIGDGKQLLVLSSINQRPQVWYVLIDSSTDVESDDFNYDEVLLHIEDEFGRFDQEGDTDDDGKVITDAELEEANVYPRLNWEGGMWDSVAICK